MTMPKQVELTASGGRFYRAMIFHHLVLAVAIVPVCTMIMIALLNPFWFRDAMFAWIERHINQFSRWRDYKKYSIYLGTDPRLWHALKGPVDR